MKILTAVLEYCKKTPALKNFTEKPVLLNSWIYLQYFVHDYDYIEVALNSVKSSSPRVFFKEKVDWKICKTHKKPHASVERDSDTVVLMWILQIFSEQLIYKTSSELFLNNPEQY